MKIIKIPIVDHGIDIIGDEWDDPKDEESGMEFEQKYVPEHPYCTNWPVTNKKEKEK